MMHFVRVATLFALIGSALVGSSLGVVAFQDSGFGCDDFLSQQAAQSQLDMDPSDPYGLDPDGDGIACEDMQASGGADAGVAQEADIDCDDFLIPQMAQAELDKNPSDPYGLDPDGNGIACDDEVATDGAPEIAPDTEPEEEFRPPLDARLGGTVESWEAGFGSPVEREGEHADLFTEYAIPGLGTVYADDYMGRIESITLFAPRPEGEEWTDDPHEMNWSVEEAHEIAEGFLPRDADLEELVREEWSDLDHVLCTSDALAAEVPQEIYDYVDNTPQYGRCSYALMHEAGGEGERISWIIIQLAIEEPLDPDGDGETAIVDLPQGDSESTQVGFSLEELAYANDVGEISESLSESANEFVMLMENPRIGQDDWTIQVATVFAIWDVNYQEALALTPPPVFAETHALFVEALRLYSEAGHDGALGIETLDPAMINQGAAKMDQANELMILAEQEVDRIRQERGG
jgi:hypothetical protein